MSPACALNATSWGDRWPAPTPGSKPAVGPHPLGREMLLIDPSSNRLRFFERNG